MKFALVVLAGVVASVSVYFVAMHFCARQVAGNDELAWLRHEFRLSDADMVKVRELHDGYLPKCREMCQRIAQKRTELEAALATHAPDVQVEQNLIELGTLRAQCQAQMLRHFEAVSRAMPDEQGKRYLAEMERLTLGFHQQFESSMRGGEEHGAHGHGNH